MQPLNATYIKRGHHDLHHLIVRVSDCCLTSSEKIFNYIIARTSYICMRWSWCPWCLLCTRTTCLAGFLIVLLTETTVRRKTMSLHSDT